MFSYVRSTPVAETYSVRRARMGSMVAARQAGTMQATRLTDRKVENLPHGRL